MMCRADKTRAEILAEIERDGLEGVARYTYDDMDKHGITYGDLPEHVARALLSDVFPTRYGGGPIRSFY